MVNQDYKDIISRYFRGQLVDSEYELLTDLLQNNTNREYFEKTKQEWEQHPELDETGNRNMNRLSYQINKTTIIRHIPITRKLWFLVASVAAVLIFGLFFGSTLTYLISQNNTISEQLVFETPRGEKSLVILPASSEVWLNASSRLVYNSFSSGLN